MNFKITKLSLTSVSTIQSHDPIDRNAIALMTNVCCQLMQNDWKCSTLVDRFSLIKPDRNRLQIDRRGSDGYWRFKGFDWIAHPSNNKIKAKVEIYRHQFPSTVRVYGQHRFAADVWEIWQSPPSSSKVSATSPAWIAPLRLSRQGRRCRGNGLQWLKACNVCSQHPSIPGV